MNKIRQKFGTYLVFKGISQVEAAEKMGISQQAISLLINSDKVVRPSTLTKIYYSFPDFKEYLAKAEEPKKSRLEVVRMIEEEEADYIKIPQFMKMVMRISKENGILMDMMQEVEDLKRRVELRQTK